MEGHQKFLGGGGSQKSKFFKQSMKVNRNFPRGGAKRKTFRGEGMVINFSGTAHCTAWVRVF